MYRNIFSKCRIFETYFNIEKNRQCSNLEFLLVPKMNL